MLGKQTLEYIYNASREIREIKKLFGGIQVVFTGDFYQLPPVKDEHCFNSPVWRKIFKSEDCVFLVENKRQDINLDSSFCSSLNKIRTGKIDKEVRNFLYKQKSERENGWDYTTLVSTNKEAELINNNKLSKLNGKLISYEPSVYMILENEYSVDKETTCRISKKIKHPVNGCGVFYYKEYKYRSCLIDEYDCSDDETKPTPEYMIKFNDYVPEVLLLTTRKTCKISPDQYNNIVDIEQICKIKYRSKVMVTSNIDDNIVNGSQGEVVA